MCSVGAGISLVYPSLKVGGAVFRPVPLRQFDCSYLNIGHSAACRYSDIDLISPSVFLNLVDSSGPITTCDSFADFDHQVTGFFRDIITLYYGDCSGLSRAGIGVINDKHNFFQRACRYSPPSAMRLQR